MITKEQIQRVQTQHSKTKQNSTILLISMSIGLLIYSMVMFMRTSDIDFLIIFNIFTLTGGIGILGLKK